MNHAISRRATAALIIGGVLGVCSLVLPLISFAQTSASAVIVGLYPTNTVPIGTTVSFTVQPTGFTNPTYTLTDSFPGGVTSGNINSSGNFTWTPNMDDIGSHNLTIVVNDSLGDSATVSEDLTVNSSPTIAIQSLTPGSSVIVGTPIFFTVVPSGFVYSPSSYYTTDSYQYSTVPYSATNSSGNFSWTPVGQDIGNHVLTITANSLGYTATTSQQITVLSNPTITTQSLLPGSSVGVGQTFSFTATSTGFFSPVYTIQESATGLSTSTISINSSSGFATWVPAYNDIGVHQIVVGASDSTGRSASTTLSVTVTQQPQNYPTSFAAPTTTSTPSTTLSAGSGLSSTQIAAILSLLQSFGADQTTIANVSAALSGSATSGGTTATDGYIFSALLSTGSSGTAITELQNRLTALGFYTGPITGYFGSLTAHAVESFQTNHGIASVGYVGPATRAALNQ